MYASKEKIKVADLPILIRRKNEIVKIPQGLTIFNSADTLEVEIDWLSSVDYYLLSFTLFWHAFIFFVGFDMYIDGAISKLLMLVPFFFMGIYLIYLTIGTLFNKTFLIVNSDSILLEHKPIKFLGQKDQWLPSKEVAQVFVTRHEVGSINYEPIYAWRLNFTMKSGTGIPLSKDLESLTDARFLEQEIEKYLQIEDEVVKGEWEEEE